MSEHDRVSRAELHQAIVCARCGSDRVRTRLETDRFEHRDGERATPLDVEIPVRACLRCGFEFTDATAEEKRHEAVCRHLGVLTPREILSLRQRYRLSRADFVRLTRIGEASLARWEGGLVIQNGSIDQLLYLMSFPENIDRLKYRQHRDPLTVEPSPVSRSAADFARVAPRFRALQATSERRTEAEKFTLLVAREA